LLICQETFTNLGELTGHDVLTLAKDFMMIVGQDKLLVVNNKQKTIAGLELLRKASSWDQVRYVLLWPPVVYWHARAPRALA